MNPYESAPPFQTLPGGMPGGPGMPPSGPGATPAGGDQKGKKDKPPTKKVVSRQFIIAVLFALVAGAIVVWAVSDKAPVTYVAVTKGPVNTNTEVNASLLKAVPVEPELVQPGAVSGHDPEAVLKEAEAQLAGVRSQFPMTANQQVIPEQFGLKVTLGEGLAPDERLVSFRASVSAAVAASIQAGDRVDIYAAADELGGLLVADVPVVSYTVSEDKFDSVAAAQAGAEKDASPQELLPSDPVPGTYTVRVKADDVHKLVVADNAGKIYLAYRGEDAVDAEDAGPITLTEAICGDEGSLTAEGC